MYLLVKRRKLKFLNVFHLRRSIAAISEIAVEFVVVTLFECDANGIPEGIFGSGGGFAKDGLDLGEELLDRIEIWAVGRQIEHLCTGTLDGLTDAGDFVR